MTLHQLRIFAAVARHLNVTRAAKKLNISQPSVSQQVKLLEAEYGVQLLRKAGRGIELTERGQHFLTEAGPILLQVEKLRARFGSKLNRGKAETLTLGGSYGPSASLLPLLSAAFRESHPEVEIILRTDYSRVVERLLLDSEVEIGVVVNPSSSPQVVVEPCRQEDLVAFVSTKHPLAKKRGLTLADLAQVPLVVLKGKAAEEKAEEILSQLQKQGLNPKIAMQCESPEAMKTSVRAGMGMGVLYRDIVAPDAQRGNLKIIKIPGLKMAVATFILYSKERPLSPNAKDYLALLRKWPKKK